MSYQKLKSLCEDKMIDADDIFEVIQCYADCLEDAEPTATNSIRAARETGYGIQDELES